MIAAYGKTLPAKADAFIQAYDAAANYKASWQKEMDEGRSACGGLLKVIRMWLPLLVRDIANFDSTTYGDQPAVPDDIISDGEQLASVVEDHRDSNNAPLGYQAELMGMLEPTLVNANKEWQEAEAADSTYQKLLAQVRDSAAIFDAELQAFRKSFAAVAGRSDKDFQKLRVEKASQKDDEDDPKAPPPSLPVPPAPPGTPLPSAEQLPAATGKPPAE